ALGDAGAGLAGLRGDHAVADLAARGLAVAELGARDELVLASVVARPIVPPIAHRGPGAQPIPLVDRDLDFFRLGGRADADRVLPSRESLSPARVIDHGAAGRGRAL